MTDHSRFWTFSLTVYADGAVQKECLHLQDNYGIDVNMLLFCAFVGAVHGALLSDQELRQAIGHVGAWQTNVIRSLRQARRTLKPFATAPSPLTVPAGVLRKSIMTAELEAERLEQTMLEEWGAARLADWLRAQPAEATASNIRTLFALCGGPGSQPDLPNHLVAAALAAA